MQSYEDYGFLKFDENGKILATNSYGEKLLTELYMAGVSNLFEYLVSVLNTGKNIFKTNKETYGIKFFNQEELSFIIIPLGEFVASISEFIDISSLHHEIKNPLTAIEGVIQVIESKYDDDYLKKCTNIIRKESSRIKYLLESVNVLTDLKLNYSDIYIDDFLKNIVDKFVIIYNKIDFILCIDDSIKKVSGDREKLEMVFNNLIKNACEAANTSRVEIRYEIDSTIKFFDREKNVFKKMLKFSIIDNGNGIDRGIRNKLFTPFWTTKSKGSGLGLVISKEIIEKHFGKIEYKSVEGEGTTFSIYLPV
ncbi:hypothetical protein LF845_04490 [Deferribacterales bacterium Es71-Z0220]|uniref:two-component system sensor histidine kinase NtrB n=1 Tax=Deferrivibrio essentukiensis TaxID=2880922 RepID=UPI001F606C36|nr:ATP-binding protein [Deferrivibrio essentukiensis]MCB4204217.1 hypothetical protein [Deferrivibrio essentukiensis]